MQKGCLWSVDMYLTGYHGTTLESANNIIEEGKFNISDSNTEWLGKGIYFYFDITDAYNWRDTEAILHSVIKINDNEYLDIDTDDGATIYNEIIDYISTIQGKEIDTSTKNSQKNQCAVMKMMWDLNPNIKAISASFATTPTKVRTLLDKRPRRKEFCVRDNDVIKCTQLIRKGDLDD